MNPFNNNYYTRIPITWGALSTYRNNCGAINKNIINKTSYYCILAEHTQENSSELFTMHSRFGKS